MAITSDRLTTIVDYKVTECPRCGQTHAFKLKALAAPKVDAKVAVFGGISSSEAATHRPELLFTCPNTQKQFSQAPSPAAGEEIIGIATDEDIKAAAAQARSATPANAEFDEWVKKSRDTAIDFCKTMLSASTGGIPVYFAVAKYVGLDKLGVGTASRVGIGPPILFLAAAICYVLALRPTYDLVAPSDFSAFRRQRLERLNQFIMVGTAMFVAAIALAIGVLFVALST